MIREELRAQGQRTREQFMRAAAEEICLRGYDGASLADIARRVGKPKAALRHHYPTKADFARDILEYQYARWAQVHDAVLAKGLTGVRLMYTLVATATSVAGEAPYARASVIIELHSHSLDFDLPAARFDWYEELTEIARQAQRDGEIRAGIEPQLTATMLLDAAFGVYLREPDLNGEAMTRRLRPTWEAALWMMGVPDPPRYLETISPADIPPPAPLPERPSIPSSVLPTND
ncbi:TetR/AcrR family transcriptional regulator [Salinibacterium sp. ZJ454]|uniref:TetR/AcrR family transcriptional regulator n=1 Tax=Salinibacterium sp. ZJ454 TaxID=2708339 RepID=UPI00141E5C9C|nr:TetR/AcrR family transcriptional regulator [Salinibacterium sp. ZJ454]